MNDTVLVLSVVSAISAGTPILFAALGEITTERSGIMNLGIEGMMLVGAITGFWIGVETENAWLALLGGALGGILLSLIHAVLAISLRVNQIVSGLALVIVGSGLSAFWGNSGDRPTLVQTKTGVRFDPIFPEVIRDLPVVGPVIFGHDPVVYLSWVLVAAISYFLYRTQTGLSLRAVGEDPGAADASGLSVTRYRYVSTLVGGFGAGLGGAYLAIGVIGTWAAGLTAGAGWIAVALVILSGWRPWFALLAAYAFGALRSLGFTLQIAGIGVPSDFLAMIPFIATYLVVIVVSASPTRARKVAGPAALAKPYSREAR
ncbi:MAG: ABC transporter permease [Acidimicrobiales bacterium]|nr:ABC transporter permease [Chloroflexota bacterium]MDP6076748.1 ABC transporter permease [Acidimicrobiales bacterium]